MFKICFSYEYLNNKYNITQSDENVDLCFYSSDVYNDKKDLIGSRHQLIIIPKNEILVKECKVYKKILIDKYQDCFIDHKNKLGILDGYTYSYVFNKNTMDCSFVGSLNDDYIYTFIKYIITKHHSTLVIESNITNHQTVKTFKALDFVLLDSTYDEVFSIYNNFFRNPVNKNVPGIISWHENNGNLDEEKLLKNIELNNSIGSEWKLIQINDSYTIVGDWLELQKDRFPHGLKYLVDKIHENNFLAGISIAPFCASSESKLFKAHKDWFYKKNDEYLIVSSQFNNLYVLDLEKEDVKEYIKKSINYMSNEIGFDFLKLDFLYCASLLEYKNKFRAQVLTEYMKLIKELSNNKILLGRDDPLGPTLSSIAN